MRFPFSFVRRVGGAGPVPVLGTDSAPADQVNLADGNVFKTKLSAEGPSQHVAIAYQYTGAGVPLPLTAKAYVYDGTSRKWFTIEAMAVTLTPGDIATVPLLQLIDAPASAGADPYETKVDTVEVALVVTPAGGDPVGTYTFLMGSTTSEDDAGGSSTPLPVGAATEATLATRATEATLEKILLGQAASSQPTGVADPDGVMNITATMILAHVYSGADLTGAAMSAGALIAPHNVSITTSAHAGSYNVGAPNAIIVTGVDYYTKSVVSESLLLTQVNGGETISGTVLFDAAALSFTIPGQVDAGGMITLGVGTAAPGAQRAILRSGTKGAALATDITAQDVAPNVAAVDVWDSSPTQAPYNYSTARGDGTAVRASDNTITITPTTLTTGQIVRVRVTTTTTAKPLVWEHGRNAVITVSGATVTVNSTNGTAITIPAAATNINVMWAGQDKAFDSSLQANRTAPLYDMRSFRQTDLVALLGANQTITNAWADVGPEVLLDGSTDFRGWFDITKGDGTVTTVQVRLLLKHTAGGTAEYAQPVSKVDVSAAPYAVTMSDEEPYLSVLDASCQRTALWRVGNTVKYGQLQIKATTPGTTMVLTATGTGYTLGWGG